MRKYYIYEKQKTERKIRIKYIIMVFFLLASVHMIRESSWSTEQEFNSFGTQSEAIYVELQNDVSYQIKFVDLVKNLQEIAYYFKRPEDGKGDITVSIESLNGDVISDSYTFHLADFNSEILRFPSYVDPERIKFGETYIMHVTVTNRKNLDPVEMECVSSSSSLAKGTGNGDAFIPYLTFSGTDFLLWDNIRTMLFWTAAVLLVLWFFPVIVVNSVVAKEVINVAVAVLGYICIEVILGDLFEAPWQLILVNIFYIYIFEKILQVIFAKERLSHAITIIFCLILGAAEYYVLEFRGTPITPWDLRVMATAATVASAYSFDIPLRLVIGIDIAVLGLLIDRKLYCKTTQSKKKIRIQNGVISAAGIAVAGIFLYPVVDVGIWDQRGSYQEDGFVAAFIANTKYLTHKKPTGYSKQKAQELNENVTSVHTEIQTPAMNVIVIMDESFADLRVINDQLVSGSYMPFIDSLENNTVKGNLYVPVFGNGTCDTEFEALTGVSTSYTGAYPYVTQGMKDVSSLTLDLKEKGYEALAFHPYLKENWNRFNVYSELGFDEFYDGDSVSDGEQMRWMLSDYADFQKIIELYENKEEDNLFIFNVTMQNHGGYERTWDNFANTVDLSAQGDFPQAEQYFSLIKETDAAFKELIDYFEKVDEPTLICFFGDHQPNLEVEYYEMLFGIDDLDDLSDEDAILQYQTPFVIWTNYDIPEQHINALSSNYLASYILYYAGYDLEGFDAFAYNLSKKYPVISRMGIIDAEEQLYTNKFEDTRLDDYEILNYYRMHP